MKKFAIKGGEVIVVASVFCLLVPESMKVSHNYVNLLCELDQRCGCGKHYLLRM